MRGSRAWPRHHRRARAGTRVTPEARSPAGCHGVLRSKCPPLASVESADAVQWLSGRPGGPGSRRYGHRCPHTFCPLTNTVKRCGTRSDLDAASRFVGVWPAHCPDPRAGQTMRDCYERVTKLADFRGKRQAAWLQGVNGAAAGPPGAWCPGRDGWAAGTAGRRGGGFRRPLRGTAAACHPRDFPHTPNPGLSRSSPSPGQRCRQSKVWKP